MKIHKNEAQKMQTLNDEKKSSLQFLLKNICTFKTLIHLIAYRDLHRLIHSMVQWQEQLTKEFVVLLITK